MRDRFTPFVLGALLLLRPLAAEEAKPVGPETSVESLLGKHGRDVFTRVVDQKKVGDKSYDFDQYAAWGRDLVLKGFVEKPPAGPAPSARLSKYYRCTHCHNVVREDARLTVSDPEAREKILIAAAPGHNQLRDGTGPNLVPGTTFWGMVNRDRYYNDYYAKYNTLKTAEGTAMNPERLTDAIQICSRFCSAGRYPEPWELDSLVAYFWTLELRLKDLDLSPEDQKKTATALAGTDPKAIEEARGHVKQSYLHAAKATLADPPKDTNGEVDIYAGGKTEKGDPQRGAVLFPASCGGCHGQDVAQAPPVAQLAKRARNDHNLPKVPRKGTERRFALYMPLFTAERLAPRQLADIRAYLRTQ